MSHSEARQSKLKRDTGPKPFTVDEARNPTLAEKMDIINQWFSLAAGGRSFEHVDLTVSELAEVFVTK